MNRRGFASPDRSQHVLANCPPHLWRRNDVHAGSFAERSDFLRRALERSRSTKDGVEARAGLDSDLFRLHRVNLENVAHKNTRLALASRKPPGVVGLTMDNSARTT